MFNWISNQQLVERVLKTAVLLLLGIFLYTRVTSGVISFYINERFFTLTLAAGLGFILLGASYFRESWGRSSDEQTYAYDHYRDRSPDNYGHDHNLTWVGLLIVMLPLILGWLVPPEPLGAAAVGNREINIAGTGLKSIAPPSGNEAVGIVTGERNILDWLGEFQRYSDPAALDGQEASVIGFVYRDDRFGETRFMVSRFTVSCCVADAAPIGLIVEWPEAMEFPDNQWVKVTGHFEASSFNGEQIPVLRADKVEQTEQPKQPYLHL
ncbi:MAG: TIGR03943 family protein [Chloroflexota bacterium]